MTREQLRQRIHQAKERARYRGLVGEILRRSPECCREEIRAKVAALPEGSFVPAVLVFLRTLPEPYYTEARAAFQTARRQEETG